MKKILLLALIVYIPQISFTQEFRSYIGMGTGVSVPVGKFASKTLNGGSFALPGLNVNVDGAWLFYKGLGAGLRATYYAHPVDVRSLGYEKVTNDPFLLDVTIRSEPYKVLTLVGFAQYSLDILKRFYVTPRIGGGMIYGISPYQLYKAEYYLIGSRWFEITSTWDLAGYFSTGGEFCYQISGCIDLTLKVEYGYGKLKYRFLTGTGDIREDIHQFMVLDALAGFKLKL